ncbi:DUF4365 domain-containing protein [Macrococcoides caseolyticum]|uniref:DUF4365 domain-containing protein n=1 Tax=Macrococcoides caseolyticum TaxID=69966 RepID=A0A855GGP9_9STAP|nr:DUF4365 domain-containing protein [Macrococcus caseolyticus]PKE26511.1 hypothetical protein CW686_04330 [Macrococcus caseolyticus]PKE59139.1 hypothetical protein CW673_03940 [Macrococcus caseolyticus]PKE69581.1 hypothetical protein CW662_08345 [Macrococcus caseolyticus]
MTENLPIFNKNQMIGASSASYLKYILQRFCLVNEIDQTQDIGIDFSATILNNNRPTKLNFYIQCKGTDNPGIYLDSGKENFCYSIATSTLNYWIQKQDITFIFLVDLPNQNIYWANPLEQVQKTKLINQKSVSIKIPLNQIINSNTKNIPDDIQFNIYKHYSNFSSAVIMNLEKFESEIENGRQSFNEQQLDTIISNLSKHHKEVERKFIEVSDKLKRRLEYDFKKAMYYAIKIDQMDEIKHQYCPKGIFLTEFSNNVNNHRYSIESLYGLIDTSSNCDLDILYTLCKIVHEFMIDILFFYRELAYEDSPFTSHADIEEEISKLKL